MTKVLNSLGYQTRALATGASPEVALLVRHPSGGRCTRVSAARPDIAEAIACGKLVDRRPSPVFTPDHYDVIGEALAPLWRSMRAAGLTPPAVPPAAKRQRAALPRLAAEPASAQAARARAKAVVARADAVLSRCSTMSVRP